MQAPEAEAIAVACPRCGYDLRGLTSTWQNACPVTGVCTECGLDFAWAELLNRTLVPPAWHVESPLRQHRFPRRVLGTLWRSILRPDRHWRALKMSHRVRWGSIGGYLIALLLVIYLCTAAATAIEVMTEPGQFRGALGERLTHATLTFLAPMNPDGFFVTPIAPPVWWRGPGPILYSAPLEFFTRIGTSVGVGLGSAVTQFMATALVFLALPITRRQCKVRMEHVWRIAALGVAIWFPLLILFVFTEPVWRLATPWPTTAPLTDLLIRGGTLLTCVLTFAWWMLAVHWYLRMTHAFWVAMLACVAGTIGAIGVALYATNVIRGF